MKLAILVFAGILSPSLAVVLNCAYENIDFPFIGYVYACRAVATSITADRSVVSIGGTHLSGKSNADVQVIEIYGSAGLTFIPVGISNYFPNLLVHGISNCPIENIVGDELNEFTNLVFAYVSNSYIEHIPGNYFSTNPDLRVVEFTGNYRLQHVGYNLLEQLPHLNEAHFDSNYCIDESAMNPAELPILKNNLRILCPDRRRK